MARIETLNVLARLSDPDGRPGRKTGARIETECRFRRRRNTRPSPRSHARHETIEVSTMLTRCWKPLE
jgi:hypothetical protein